MAGEASRSPFIDSVFKWGLPGDFFWLDERNPYTNFDWMVFFLVPTNRNAQVDRSSTTSFSTCSLCFFYSSPSSAFLTKRDRCLVFVWVLLPCTTTWECFLR
jgi:hypothetical protein